MSRFLLIIVALGVGLLANGQQVFDQYKFKDHEFALTKSVIDLRAYKATDTPFSFRNWNSNDQAFVSFQVEQNLIENGMLVLSTMATTNMAVSTYNLIRGDNNDDFDVTNLLWNSVNLGIGIAGLLTNKKSFSKLNSEEEMLSLLKKNRNIVLINAGVDLGYIGLGIWRRTKNKGQGDAIIYNGALLFVFDTIFGLMIHKKIKNRQSKMGIHSSQDGVGLRFSLN